jgi:hypothetical protein
MLPDWARALADTFDLERVADVVVDVDLPAAWPALVGNTGFAAMLRESAVENLRWLRDHLAGRLDVDAVVLARPSRFGRMQAELGIPQSALQKSYRVGFMAIWEQWTAHLETGARAAGVDEAELLSAVKASTRLIFAYQDMALTAVAAEHHRVDELRRSSRAHLRNHLVRQLLSDDDSLVPTNRDLFVTLEYEVSLWHVAVLLPRVNDSAIASLATELRRRCGVRALTFELSTDSTVVWFGRTTGWPFDALADLDDTLRGLDFPTCRSDPASGLAGLRTTFAQARQVSAVRRRWQTNPSGLLTYSDVRLEALLSKDPDAATSFVREELGPLTSPNAEATRLRATLAAWLDTGSHVSAAESLGVHEHTVRNRMRRIEQLLGRPVRDRRTEIQVALRLHALLSD